MLIAARNAMLAGGAAPGPTPAYWGLCFTAEEPGVVVNMAKVGSPLAVTLETSTDGVTWTAFDVSGGTTPITLAAVGDCVYFRAGSGGNTNFCRSSSAYRCFTISGLCKSSGNIMSLLNGDDSTNVVLPGVNYTFGKLFINCTALTAAPSLPATTLANNCYYCMFQGCTSLTTAPSLPATTLKGSCYYSMFQGCTSLTTAPSLPATTMATNCYRQMFYGCTALTAAPELPAAATESSCYSSMFNQCALLNEITVGLITWTTSTGSSATTNWLSGVAASGTFRCPTALGTNATITRGVNYCPTGWTVVNTDA